MSQDQVGRKRGREPIKNLKGDEIERGRGGEEGDERKPFEIAMVSPHDEENKRFSGRRSMIDKRSDQSGCGLIVGKHAKRGKRADL